MRPATLYLCVFILSLHLYLSVCLPLSLFWSLYLCLSLVLSLFLPSSFSFYLPLEIKGNSLRFQPLIQIQLLLLSLRLKK
jgi:hypothetical protein